jgi:hypothetical protein
MVKKFPLVLHRHCKILQIYHIFSQWGPITYFAACFLFSFSLQHSFSHLHLTPYHNSFLSKYCIVKCYLFLHASLAYTFHAYCDLITYDNVQSGGWVPTFLRNILFTFTLKKEAVRSLDTSVSIYQNTQWNNPEYHNIYFNGLETPSLSYVHCITFTILMLVHVFQIKMLFSLQRSQFLCFPRSRTLVLFDVLYKKEMVYNWLCVLRTQREPSYSQCQTSEIVQTLTPWTNTRDREGIR